MFQIRRIFYNLLALFILINIVQCKNDDDAQDQEDAPTLIKDDYFEDYEAPTFKWGFMNKEGHLMIAGKYDQVKSFSEGRAGINYRGQWGFIDTMGIEVIKPQYIKVSSFSNDLANVRNFEGNIGFIDRNGKLIIEHIYKSAGNFFNNFCSIKVDGKYGFVNNLGNEVISPIFDQVWPFYSLSSARVKTQYKYALIDPTGELLSTEYDKIYSYSNGYYRFKEKGKYGLMDSSANIVIYPKNDNISSLKYDHIVRENNKKWTLLNIKTGKEVSKFDHKITIIGSNQLRYLSNGKLGVKDYQNNELLSAEYDQINNYSEGTSIAMKDEKWIAINEDGQIITDSTYTLLWDMKEGMIKMIDDNAIGFLNQHLKPAIPEIYNEAKQFSENRSAVQITK